MKKLYLISLDILAVLLFACVASSVVANPVDYSKENVLIVSSLDGSLTGISPQTGHVLWNLNAGGFLVGSRRTRAAPASSSDTSGERGAPLLIPGVDGSVVVGSNSGLKQLPFKVNEIVGDLPLMTGDALVLGSKVTRAFEISLSTGRLLKTVDGLSDETFQTSEQDPNSVWFTRSDYVIRAFDTSNQKQTWNLTYGNITPLHSYTLKPMGVSDEYSRSYYPYYLEYGGSNESGYPSSNTIPKSHRLTFSITFGGHLIATFENGTKAWSTDAFGVPIISIYGVHKHMGETRLVTIPYTEIWPGHNHYPVRNPVLPTHTDSSRTPSLPYGTKSEATPNTHDRGVNDEDNDPLTFTEDSNGKSSFIDASASPTVTRTLGLEGMVDCDAMFVGSLPTGELFAHPMWKGHACKGSKKAKDIESGATGLVKVYVNSDYASLLHVGENTPALRSFLSPSNVLEYALSAASYDLGLPLSESHALLPTIPLSDLISRWDTSRMLPSTDYTEDTTRSEKDVSECTDCDDGITNYNSELVVYDANHEAISLVSSFWENIMPDDEELSCLVGFHSVPYLIEPDTIEISPYNDNTFDPMLPIASHVPHGALDSGLLYLTYERTASLLYRIFPEDLAKAADITLHLSLTYMEKNMRRFSLVLVLFFTTFSIYKFYFGIKHDDALEGAADSKLTSVPTDSETMVVHESVSTSTSSTQEQALVSPTVTSSTYPEEIEMEVDGQLCRVIGPLTVSQEILGWGAQGTVVFSGTFEGRNVAVKRLLKSFHPSAAREISLLIKGDGHRAVVRYYSCIEVKDFLYLALEKSEGSLENALALCRRPSVANGTDKHKETDSTESRKDGDGSTGRTTESENGPTEETTPLSNRRNFSALRPETRRLTVDEARTEWSASSPIVTTPSDPTLVAPPSPYTREFLLLLMEGLTHLHMQGIAHRDIKPGNILIASDRPQHTKPYADLFHELRNSRTMGDLPMIYSDPAYREPHIFGTGYWIPKISDFGLGKYMHPGQSYNQHFSTFGNYPPFNPSGHPSSLLNALHQRFGGPASQDGLEHTFGGRVPLGTTGWQAPEILLPLTEYHLAEENNVPDVSSPQEEDGEISVSNSDSTASGSSVPSSSTSYGRGNVSKGMRNSTKVPYNPMRADVWALGCVMYAIVTGGDHPFGLSHERENNVITQNGPNLQPIEHIHDLHHLASQVLSHDPKQRPSTSRLLEHPFFWSDETKTTFLVALSDRLEGEKFLSPLVKAFAHPKDAPGLSIPWDSVFHVLFLEGGRKQKTYNPNSMVDCLRFFRNRRNHWHELSPSVFVDGISPSCTSSALVPYFTHPKRLPGFFMYAYQFVLNYLAHERQFSVYLGKRTTKMYADKSREAAEALMKGELVHTSGVEANDSTSPATRGWYDMDWPSTLPNSVQTVMDPAGQLIPVLAAHSHLQETRFRGGANAHLKNYKHRLCFDFENSDGTFCPRGIRCDFSHGVLERLNINRFNQF